MANGMTTDGTLTTAAPPPAGPARNEDGAGSGLGRMVDARMRGAVAAEWTKLWSLRSTWWGLAAAFVLMGAMSMMLAGSVVSNNTNDLANDDQGVASVSGIAVNAMDMVQFVVLALVMLMITGEYSTGSVRSTLQCTPSRARMLLSKAVVAVAVMLPTGILMGLLGTAVAAPMLGEWGRFSAGDAAWHVTGCGVYLALISVFVLGIGTLLRSTAATLTTAFLSLLVLPIMLGSTSVTPLKRISDSLPSSAGRHYMNDDAHPYPALAGLAILLAWTAAGLFAGHTVLRKRDA